MAEHAREAPGRQSERAAEQPAEFGIWPRTKQWMRRARSVGHERYTLLIIGKSALAAAIAWFVAYTLLRAESPAFAPFSAVLMMQVTVYQSLAQSVRYVGAVAAGVVVQGLIGFVVGPGLLTFVLVTVIALAIGRWPRLGTQGSQVVTAAFFAFAVYITAADTMDRATQLGQILLMVAIGCAVGILVNLLVAPPMRFRSAEYAVRAMARSMCDLLADMHPALREGEFGEERTGQWRQRANQFETTIAQARSAVRTAEESVYYNPRRLLSRHRHRTFTGYQDVESALERIAAQISSATRALDLSVTETEEGPQRTEFLRLYADFLSSLGDVTEELGEVDEDRLVEQTEHLCALVQRSEDYADRLVEGAADITFIVTDRSSPYGTLLVEASRLQEEFQYTCDVLQRCVNRELRPRSRGRQHSSG